MNQQKANLQTRNGEAIAFLGCQVFGELRGLLYEARVEQNFCNHGNKNVEVVYTFPLPWGAVLLGVDVILGDKCLSGQVVQKARAETAYEEALADGDAAIMLEKNTDHSYCLNLGNLAAGEKCRITLRYAQTLPFEQGGLRLMIPTVIAPRYGDAVQDGGLKPYQAPEFDHAAEYPFMLEIRLYGELAKARIASPSHPLSFSRTPASEGEIITVTLARQAKLDRDFILVVDQLAHNALAVCATDALADGSHVVLASFHPRFAHGEARSTNVKLLVDCSGSMGGDSIEAAKRALAAIVRQLAAGDHFSLSRFGSTVEHRSRGLWKLTDVTAKAAQRWISELNADLGGTEMEAALTSTFALDKSVSCDVLLVTDGEISAIDSTIAAAKQSGHRLFIVGIGSSPAETHLRRLAEACGGACDFVAPGEVVEPAVLRMFTRLRSPSLSKLSLEWPEGLAPQWVSPLPRSVFDGDSFNVFAWIGQAPAGRLRLQGCLTEDGEAQEISALALDCTPEHTDTLPRLAAAQRCQSETKKAGAQRAVDYQIVTDETNFLLVHERTAGEKADDMPEQYKVRQMVADGWYGAQAVLGCAPAPAVSAPSPGGFLSRLLRQPVDHVAVSASRSSDEDRAPKSYQRLDTPHYKGLSPSGLAEWLHDHPAASWPQDFAGLRQIGLGDALLDWLELVIGQQADSAWPEAALVAAFCSLMSQEETRKALKKSNAFFAPPDAINKPLLETLAKALAGMTASAWPEQVFSLDGADRP